MSVSSMRTEYRRARLDESDVAPDPIRQFQAWFEQALSAEVPEANAMTLATSTADGRPSARVVLLRGCDERGFTFFTNYQSRKGRELDANPHAALVFFWPELERQVRVEGRVVLTTEEESDAYYHSRPSGARIGAWASPQSEVIPDRSTLERAVEELEARHAHGPIPRPPHWGGYRVVPEVVEFWQGRPSRLHDRIRYRRQDEGWVVERLAP